MPQTLKPPKLHKGYKDNFQTLLKAADNDDLCLISAIRKSDRKPVALVCAMNIEQGDGEPMFCPVPLAVLCEGNPFEDFEDPTQA